MPRIEGMRRLVLAAAVAVALTLPSPAAGESSGRPVALVTAETENEVLAVSLGPHGGRVLRRVHLVDPVMVAAPLHGPAVVVSPRGTVTLLAWHTLRPIKVFHAFRSPQVAAIAPGGRFAYVADGGSGDLVVIDLRRRRIVHRVFVGAAAHHLSFSPDGRWLWVALGEDATTVVRLDTSNLRRPRVVGRIHPPTSAHDVKFSPDGTMVWISSPTASQVSIYSAGGKLLEGAIGGRGPQHLAFSGNNALVSSGYSARLESLAWRSPYHRLRTAAVPYGSFNLATYNGFVVTSSLFTGQVSELRVRDLHRLWTKKVAPAARYVAISVWPDPPPHRTLNVPAGRVVRRFTLREPNGFIRLFRLVVPHGVRADVTATIPGLAGVRIDSAPVCTYDVHANPTCRRTGPYDVWTEGEEACPMPPAVWHLRLVKASGPAGRIRVVFRVG